LTKPRSGHAISRLVAKGLFLDQLLVLDVGTSALKAVLFDRTGAVTAAASAPIATKTATDRSAEQSVDDWWQAAVAAAAKLPGRDSVAAVALTGSMQNLIALSPDGVPAGPAILYSDRRLDGDEVDALQSRLPADYATRTGNRLDPAHTILKIMRLERYLPTGRDALHFLFGAKDAVIHHMTGKMVIDPTTATTTGLFNISDTRWDAELMAAACIKQDHLPKILRADAVAGKLLDVPAKALGLQPGIPVFNGAGDGATATWGALADRPASAYVYIGTTGWVAETMALSEAAPPRDIYTLADPIHTDRAILIAPFMNAGSALEWLSEVTSVAVETLLANAEEEAPGPLFLPYLSGERAPFEDQAVRGAFLGLDRNHRPGALCRALLEGIAFAVRHNLETAGLPTAPLTAIGGGARSPLLRQILADSLGRRVSWPPASREMPALGVYRMVAPKLGFSPVEEHHDAAAVEPRPREITRTEQRYQAYLEATRFARTLSSSLTSSLA
jgi:xylulokinase